MLDGLRFNGVRHARQFITKPNLSAGGAAFYDGDAGEDMSTKEARQWIHAVLNRTAPCVLPEQAYTVTRILEGIYESSKTGDVFYFDK
jgi:predicted dehydrogenase